MTDALQTPARRASAARRAQTLASSTERVVDDGERYVDHVSACGRGARDAARDRQRHDLRTGGDAPDVDLRARVEQSRDAIGADMSTSIENAASESSPKRADGGAGGDAFLPPGFAEYLQSNGALAWSPELGAVPWPGLADVRLVAVGRVFPRHSFLTWEIEEGLDHRPFAALFRRVWSSLPLYVRRRMLAFWRDRDSCGDPRLRPTVRLVRLLGYSNKLGNELALPLDAMGAVNLDGSLVRFSADWIAVLPEDAAAALVAHELAHVYCRVSGCWYLDDDDEHEEVRWHMETWGYDDECITRACVSVLPYAHCEVARC